MSYTATPCLFHNQTIYCSLKIDLDKCKWWEFSKKRILKDLMRWFYPLMANEVKFIINDI